MVGAAQPERDHVRAQAGLPHGLLLDGGNDPASGGKGFPGGCAFGHRVIDARCDVLDGLEHIQFEVEAPGFVGRRAGEEPVAEIIPLRGAQLLQGVGADVVVGNEEAVLADEAARAARVEADGGLLQVIEPGWGGVKPVTLAQEFAGGLVEEPEAFVGAGAKSQGAG